MYVSANCCNCDALRGSIIHGLRTNTQMYTYVLVMYSTWNIHQHCLLCGREKDAVTSIHVTMTTIAHLVAATTTKSIFTWWEKTYVYVFDSSNVDDDCEGDPRMDWIISLYLFCCSFRCMIAVLIRGATTSPSERMSIRDSSRCIPVSDSLVQFAYSFTREIRITCVISHSSVIQFQFHDVKITVKVLELVFFQF